MWMNECQSFCQFDIERHTAGSQFLSTCYKTMFVSENKFLYSLSSSLFNGTLVDPSYDDPPPQNCTVGCMNGCAPRDIGCRWNSTLHLPELYDVATGAVITDDQPVVNYTGTTNNDANNDAFNITYEFCYEFNLPIGSVGYRDAPPGIASDGQSVACDESNLPYVINNSCQHHPSTILVNIIPLSLIVSQIRARAITLFHSHTHTHTHTTLGMLLGKPKTKAHFKIFVLQRAMRTLDLSFN
jgi:hypothetical protein